MLGEVDFGQRLITLFDSELALAIQEYAAKPPMRHVTLSAQPLVAEQKIVAVVFETGAYLQT